MVPGEQSLESSESQHVTVQSTLALDRSSDLPSVCGSEQGQVGVAGQVPELAGREWDCRGSLFPPPVIYQGPPSLSLLKEGLG